MNTIKYASTLLAVMAALLTGCADLDDIYKEYLGDGQKVYVGKADSLVVFGGYNRAKIVGWMHYAKTAEKCIIRWDNDSITVAASEWQANDTLSVIINDLTEGSKRFFVQTYDKEGNRSLKVECNGYIYGEMYLLMNNPKIITLMTPGIDGMTLTWSTSESASFVEVRYDSDDGAQTLLLPGNVTETILTGWVLGGKIESRTAFIPEAAAIDTFYTGWVTQYFPESVEYKLDKTIIKPMNLAADANTGYSGRREAVFDGSVNGDGNQFHSGGGVGVPQHLTFDLGVIANLTWFEIWARSDGYNNWNPKIIQIWGSETLDASSTVSLPSSDAGWEDEALSKGWTLLTESVCNQPVNNKITIDHPSRARYIIIRTKEVYGDPKSGGGAYVIIQEMDLYADYLERITD
jgi:hypothetical protein